MRRLVETIDRVMDSLDTPFGANAFLGSRTRRLFNLLARDPLFAEVPLFPPVLDVASSVLDDGLLASVGLPGLAARPPDQVAFSDGVHAEFGRPARVTR